MLFVVIGGLAFVGYQIYLGVNQIQAQATKNIGNKNISFSKDGLRVKVKEVHNEEYVDKTQRVFVDVWNQHAATVGQTTERKKSVPPFVSPPVVSLLFFSFRDAFGSTDMSRHGSKSK